MTIQITAHFRQRVTERLPGIDPDLLASTVWDEVNRDTGHVSYDGRRVSIYEGQERVARCFRFALADGLFGKVVVDDGHAEPVFITAWRDAQ